MRKISLLALMCVLGISCTKTRIYSDRHQSASEESYYKAVVGQALAKAVAQEPELRAFIKSESLKQFDNDYDILFQVVRNSKVKGNETFYDLLAKNANSVEVLNTAIDKLPLLTVFVPTLPNFTPENWKTESEVPKVAIEADQSIKSKQSITFYDGSGGKSEIEDDLIPAFPTLVIKNNERVVVAGSALDLRKQYANADDEFTPYTSVNGISYIFTGKAFDGTKNGHYNEPLSRAGLNLPQNNAYSIDKVNVDAYNSGAPWHRDFVYYEITPSNPNGIYRNNFHEYIKSFRFLNANEVDMVSDEPNDPKPNTLKTSLSAASFTEGNYEFYMDIAINFSSGGGQIIHKTFTCKGSDLFDIEYVKRIVVYVRNGVTAKEYNPNVELFPWDLRIYGNAWQFLVSEHDVSATTTRQVSHTSTFAGNIGITDPTNPAGAGLWQKIGAAFGLSASTSRTVTETYSYTTASDLLGDGILGFDYAIITSLVQAPGGFQVYNTYETNTGRVSFSVEPVRVW